MMQIGILLICFAFIAMSVALVGFTFQALVRGMLCGLTGLCFAYAARESPLSRPLLVLLVVTLTLLMSLLVVLGW